MAANTITEEQLRALARYVRDQSTINLMNKAKAHADFVEWARGAAVFVLDKLDDAWAWVRRYFGLDAA